MEDYTLIIPALNEGDRIGQVLQSLSSLSKRRVIVVDNGSLDDTTSVARSFGVTVLQEPRQGKGFAVIRGAHFATTDRVFLCDGDISGLTVTDIDRLVAASKPDRSLSRLSISREPDQAPVTLLTVRPILSALGVDFLAEPIGGLALVNRKFLISQHIPGGWGFDIGLTLCALRQGQDILELRIGGVTHRRKSLLAYESMAFDVARAALQIFGTIAWDHTDCIYCDSSVSLIGSPASCII